MTLTTVGEHVSGELSGGAPEPLDQRVIGAALACFSRWGIAKTTAEDIAREAGVSRASVYRSFPGGKGAILDAAGSREIGRLMSAVVAAASAQDSLVGVLTEGIVVGCEEMRTHSALTYLLEHEPEAVLPFLAFDRLGPALDMARNGCSTTVARFVPLSTAEELVEWATRMVLSLAFMPGRIDALRRETVENMVEALLLPGIVDEMYPDPIPTPAPNPPHTDKDSR